MPPISAAGTPVLAFKSNCVCRPETPATSSAGMDALRSPCRSCPEILEAAADNGLAFLQHEHGESLSVSRLKFWQQKARWHRTWVAYGCRPGLDRASSR